MRELRSATEWRRAGSGVGAGSPGCLSAVDWRTLPDAARDAAGTRGRGSLRRRVQGRGYGG